MINWERHSDALRAIHDAISAGGGAPKMTIFGQRACDNASFYPLGFMDWDLATAYAGVQVPLGKTLELHAIGLMWVDGGDPSNSIARVWNITTGEAVKTTAQGSKYEFYSDPPSVSGPADLRLEGKSATAYAIPIAAYMVFSIE